MSTRTFEHDVVIVGGGGAGLRAAIAAHEEGADVAIVTKLHPVRSHTGAAEGGINAVLRDGDEVEMHIEDTMKGSDYLADAPAVETLCRESPQETIQLENWGMPFSREEDERVSQRPFGGLSFPRTTYAGAETGHHLLHVLYEQVVKRGITVYDEWYVMRLVTTPESDPSERTCHGLVAVDVSTGELGAFVANKGVVLATGGLGQVYSHTTNAVANTGDGYAMAYRVGVPLEDMEFVQFHPTTLPATGVLISEGVRGEGGILFNSEGERFMFEYGYAVNAGELASRDVVSRAELTEINEGRGVNDDYVHLDMRHLGEDRILDRLENIVHLAEDFQGVNPLEEPMPVKPGQHYQMGGIETNEYGETIIDGLYAVGETACASVHGANRLGGNALPELIVLGKMAGRHAAGAALPAAEIPVGRTADSETGTIEGSIEIGVGSIEDVSELTERSTALSPRELVESAVETERTRVRELLDRETDVKHSDIRKRVQETMGANVNVFRERSQLLIALEDIQAARQAYQDVSVSDPSRTFNTDLIHTIETRNVIDLAEAITIGALARTEFRGAHWRKEHQERDDENWLKHTLLSWNRGSPEVWFKPVVLDGEAKTYTPKERSY